VSEPTLAAQLLAAGAAHCSAAIQQHGGLISSLFIAGLVGSASHCVGMCGPFVLSQTVARLEDVPAARMQEWHRLAGAALVPYHLGRATTYVALGTAAAVLAGGMIELAGLRWVSTALLAVAALFFLVYALQALKLRLPSLPSSNGSGWWSRVIGRRLQPLFARPVGWRGYLLGVALGFLPCGLLYGAIAAASASGDALAGAFAMLAFTAGTVPALLAVGLAGHVAGSQWRELALRIAPLIMLANAAALTYLAWRSIA
jgi:sulfite exporter TauE/SafE